MPHRGDSAELAATGDRVELEVERVVAGGAGLAREPAGRVVLVDGALPGERVAATIRRSKPRMATADLAEVLVAAPGRTVPPCPELVAGCGGCDMQHATPGLQRELKVSIVRDALAHIGGMRDVAVGPGEHLPDTGFRTTVRAAVRDGRAGFHRRSSADVHVVEGCLVAHPLVDEILRDGWFPGAAEVTIRVGARTGERLVLVSPGSDAGAATSQVVVPDDVVVIHADEDSAGEGPPGWVHEVVARRRLRISARSFFQARPDGAEALIRAVARALAPFDPDETLVDLYGGVGLFSAGLGARGGVLVERSDAAIADAEVNLASLGTRVVRSRVERWRPEPAAAVVADPSRAGLGADGVRAVLATGAERVALVSCDPAALARDARLLVDRGYDLAGVELVDMFPHTHHVEAVSAFRRTDRVG